MSPRAEETGAQGRRRRTGEDRQREASPRGTGSFFQAALAHSADMPNFAGTWKMKSSENFDELLKALGKLLSPLSLPHPPPTPSCLSPAASLHEVNYPSCPHRKGLFLFLGENAVLDSQQHDIVFRRSFLGKKKEKKWKAAIYGRDVAEGKPLGSPGDMKQWMLNSCPNRRGIVT